MQGSDKEVSCKLSINTQIRETCVKKVGTVCDPIVVLQLSVSHR